MYLEIAELTSDVPALLDFDNKERLAGIVAQVIYKVSRIFDAETFAPEGYYGWKPTNDFVVRQFRSNGTNFLHTYHFTELNDVSYNNGSLLGRTITKQNNQCIEIGYATFLHHRSLIGVSAKWGWLSIPEDVKEAVAAKCRVRLSVGIGARNGLDSTLEEEEKFELNKVWENAILRYRHLNQFVV